MATVTTGKSRVRKRATDPVGPVVLPRISIKVIRSLMGSDYTFPTKTIDGVQKTLTAPWDRSVFLPPEFVNDPYVLDAASRGVVEIKESDRMPAGPEPFPPEIEADSMLRGWVTALIYGPYTPQFKAFLEDWRNPRLASAASNKGAITRVVSLKQRILPLIRCAAAWEARNQNRKDVLGDLRKVEQFIVNEEWQWDVQQAKRQ